MAWISNNTYLNTADQQNNATEFWNALGSWGWSVEAVCGMLGNIQSESTVNPGVWQNFDEGNLDLGLGLVQWTPATKLISWCSEQGYSYTDGLAQCLRIQWELENGEQWIPTIAYPMTFEEFHKSTLSPYNLAIIFLMNYERPREAGADVQATRGNQAQDWYRYLEGKEPIPPGPVPGGLDIYTLGGISNLYMRKRGLINGNKKSYRIKPGRI